MKALWKLSIRGTGGALNHDVENAIENGELHDIVHHIVLGDGSIRYVHQKGRTYYGDDGRPERMAGTTQT